LNPVPMSAGSLKGESTSYKEMQGIVHYNVG
jgi:hypothetical protein